ncbi:UbiA family prenyltransferase [Williamsia sp. MIQD14]|uniref:UbiA family prenyltransferase n=1 Tax=Williamsia sp. MIQD14 TaxID=3425703 RepID=UPI003D9FBBC6
MVNVVALSRAGHLPPAVAVTALSTVLAATGDVAPAVVVTLAIAVFTGQLVVGWTNDLIDRDTDIAVHRTDKPLVVGTVTDRVVGTATVIAAAVCVIASLLCGLAAGTVHLVAGVGAALAYNLGVKRTVFSWVPYLLAFGSVPIAVGLASRSGDLPPAWVVAMAALLGVGAHLLNVFPDLDDDAVTGMHGLPHRLGHNRIPVVAAALLVGATLIGVLATQRGAWQWVALVVVVVMAAVCTRAPGRAPFYATMVIAGIDLAIIVIR